MKNTPNFITRDWASGDRGQRIVDMIEERLAAGQITQADLAAIQFDSYSLVADTYLPLLNNVDMSDPRVQEAADILNKWNRQERREETAPVIFEIFLLKLYPAIVQDEIGPENVEKLQKRNNIFLHKIANEPMSPWWDNVDTPGRENREDILLQAMTEALDWLDENVPGGPDAWTWGDLHQAPFVSDPLGKSGVGPIEALVNRGPFPADGGNSLVNAVSWDLQAPARVNWHPSMRMLVDMSDFDASQMVIPTGQSGHPGSPHYDDQIELWLNGEYHPMWWSDTAVQSAAADTLILQPEN
ncbi:MAG: penicillin acylase family protein [Chloroflexi bacterium]|nr:penicillin acylase family protein [Chloroflexota bacterium]